MISISNIQAQENTIVLSDLFGAWRFQRIEKGDNYDIEVYQRCAKCNLGQVHRFYTNGNFEIQRTSGHQSAITRGPRRCGNEYFGGTINSTNSKGTYSFDEVHQQIVFKHPESKFESSWDLIWIDQNSFGVKKLNLRTAGN